MLSFVLFSVFVFLPFITSATETGDSIYTVVDKLPKFKGNPSRTASFIQKNLVYPDKAWMQGTEAVVNVSFTVTKHGQLMNAKVENEVDPLLAMEALRVVDLMTEWRPAKKDGKVVHCRVSIPVVFSLSADEKAFISNMHSMGLDKNLPLYVIDDKIVKSRIHLPSYNVKSIRVLKGKSAIDKYGDDGKNGVVVISTKRGTKPVR